MNKLFKTTIAVAAILLLASFGIKNETADNVATCCVLCSTDLFGEPYTKLEKDVKNELLSLGYTITKDSIMADYIVRIEAKAREYSNERLENDVKNELAVSGSSVINDTIKTNLEIRVEAESREYSNTSVGGKPVYCVYVDANVSIEKSNTGQPIYEDEISAKGVHTLNYKEAGRNAYKNISEEIRKLLKDKLGL